MARFLRILKLVWVTTVIAFCMPFLFSILFLIAAVIGDLTGWYRLEHYMSMGN